MNNEKTCHIVAGYEVEEDEPFPPFIACDSVAGPLQCRYTTLCSPRVFSMSSITPRVMTIMMVARAAMVGSKWYST